MERLLDLKHLGARLRTLDDMLLALAMQRLLLAEGVERIKRKDKQPIFRSEIEDDRIQDARKWAIKHGMNPHFAESLAYLMINESCKRQLIQMQAADPNAPSPQNDDEWYAVLKRNLLRLTERWHMSYDASYDDGYSATQSYRRFEQALLEAEIGKLTHTGLLLDLGCATGRTAFMLHERFDQAIGYDVSQHMQARARQLADERGLAGKLSFEQCDLEDGIPLEDSVASFIAMNLGTASDMRDIRKVLAESMRVLKPGGRFFFSFYNRDALIYALDFIPWPLDLAATVNVYRDSLDVHSFNEVTDQEEVIPIYAKAYGMEEIRSLFANLAVEASYATHPTIAAILPNVLLERQPEFQGVIENIDLTLSASTMGAYAIATGERI